MGDGAWLEQGDVPMLSIHSKYDFFAPYDTGMVYVPIGTQFFAVVSVTGSYGAIKAANAYGNNDIFLNENYTDAVWVDQQSTNPTGEECLYTVEIPRPIPRPHGLFLLLLGTGLIQMIQTLLQPMRIQMWKQPHRHGLIQ